MAPWESRTEYTLFFWIFATPPPPPPASWNRKGFGTQRCTSRASCDGEQSHSIRTEVAARRSWRLSHLAKSKASLRKAQSPGPSPSQAFDGPQDQRLTALRENLPRKIPQGQLQSPCIENRTRSQTSNPQLGYAGLHSRYLSPDTCVTEAPEGETA